MSILLNLPEGMDGVLVTSPINQRYLTEFDYTDGYVLATRGKSYLIADSRYIEAAKNSTDDKYEKVLLAGSRKELLNKYFKAENIRILGFEDNDVSYAKFESFKKDFPDMEFKPIGNIIEDLREHKTAAELDSIIKAQRIAELALDHILGYIKPEMTEKQVALELEFFMRSHGAEAASFDTIAVSGRASSLPHGVPRDVTLERGFLTMDFGALYNGYCSDMTRTVCIGKADEKQKKIYNTVLEAQLAALEACKIGAKCLDIDKAARDVITAAGYGEYFGHGLGHGVGLLIHEAPRLSRFAGNAVLSEGHVVTVEPGIYIEGCYGVRIEDMIAVHDGICENITLAPKNLIEL